MAFSRHEPCPRCRSKGQDTAGNNLGRWDNGSAFCFACHYMERPTGWKPPEDEEEVPPPKDLVPAFPKEHIDWLSQYLTLNEIHDNFKYSPRLGMHVYINGKFWQGRSVNPKAVTSHGDKPIVFFGTFPIRSPLVIVEDVVSAIKVGRVTSSLPLFGSHMPGDWMARIARMKINRVVFWLDADKVVEGRKMAQKLAKLGPLAHAMYTKHDPKYYSEGEIRTYVGL